MVEGRIEIVQLDESDRQNIKKGTSVKKVTKKAMKFLTILMTRK